MVLNVITPSTGMIPTINNNTTAATSAFCHNNTVTTTKDDCIELQLDTSLGKCSSLNKL